MYDQTAINSTDSLKNYQERLSNIGQDFDIALFIIIFVKSIKWIVLFFILSALLSFLYLRYTPPLYETSAILQIATQNTAKKVLNVENIFERDIAGEIELLRANSFLSKAFAKLQLDIGYYGKGKVLNFEQYTGSPYTVKTRNVNSALYDVPVYVSFPTKDRIFSSYTLNGETYEKAIDNGVWTKLNDVEIMVTVKDFVVITSQQNQFNQDPYFFVIKNPSHIIPDIYAKLDIRILNEAAKTIQVRFEDTNPKKAADIVNAIADAFVAYDVTEKGESANKILYFVDEQLALVYDKLRGSESKIQSYKKENKMAGNKDFVSIYIDRLDNFENELLDLELEETTLGEIEKMMADVKNIDIYNLMPVLTGAESHKEISRLISSLQELLTQKEKILYTVKPGSAEIQELEYRINLQKKLLYESIKALKSRISSKKDNLTVKVKDIESKFFNLPATELEYARLLRMFSINEKFYNMLLEKKAEYSIARAGYVSKNIILQNAPLPVVPISPDKKIITAFGIATGSILSVLLLVLLYLMHNDITSLADIMKATKASILGIIPEYKKDIPVSQLLIEKNPKSLIAESFRSVRTNLQFISNTTGPKLVAVTSTVSGEGKTFIAINLAGIIAFSERKVIVIDLDLRKPKIHLGFNVNNNKGVSTILIGENTAEECIYKSNIKNLDFITAGPVPPNPSELIISKKMEELLESLKKNYDVIVIDTPPVGIVTDGISCIQKADYPIYVFKTNISKKHYIKNVDRLISENNIKGLSVILNGVDAQSNISSKYGYGQNYGYGYGSYGYGYYDEEHDTDNESILKKFIKKITFS